MGEIIDISYGALCRKVKDKFYRESKRWYSELLKKHFPSMSFSIWFPHYATDVPDRSILDNTLAIRPRGTDRTDLDAAGFEMHEEDITDLGKKLKGILVSGQPKLRPISKPEDYLFTTKGTDRTMSGLTQRRDFLLEKGYRGKFFTESGFMGYVYKLKGDGTSERVARFLEDFIEACK